MSNTKLNDTQKNVDDEYYTRMEEIEEAVPYVAEELEGKEVEK